LLRYIYIIFILRLYLRINVPI